jgi:hypothetical protein
MLHPDTTRALARVSDDVAAGPITFKQLDTMRQIINDAAGSSSPKDQRVGLIFRDSFDDFVNGLKQPDVTGPNPQFAIDSLNAARDLYRRVVNGERIQELLRRADLRASGQFTSAGYEHAIRTEFKSLAMNPGEMRRFTPFERTAIERVVRGGNTRANITNVFRAVGKFAPRGPVATTLSTALGVGGGYAVGGPAGATAGPAALMTIGEAGRQTATALTSRNARLVSELMRRGGPPLPLQLPPAVSGAVAGGAVAPPWQVQDDPQKRLAALLQQRNR